MTQALHSETFPHWKSESGHSFQLSATGNRLPPQQTLWIASSSKANTAQTMVWQGLAGRLKESSPRPSGPPVAGPKWSKVGYFCRRSGTGAVRHAVRGRVRGMDLECWLTQVWGPQRPQEATLSPPAARWRADNDPWPWPRRSQIPGHPERFPQERPHVCVCVSHRKNFNAIQRSAGSPPPPRSLSSSSLIRQPGVETHQDAISRTWKLQRGRARRRWENHVERESGNALVELFQIKNLRKMLTRNITP